MVETKATYRPPQERLDRAETSDGRPQGASIPIYTYVLQLYPWEEITFEQGDDINALNIIIRQTV